MNEKKTIRCAIYTRKSTEEGLQQDYNSLDAQRDAGEAYIKSQKHEGWMCLPEKYDDGGYTGGNLDRPAAQRLLADVQDGDLNLDSNFVANRFMAPKPVEDIDEMQQQGYIENWICYRSSAFCAKELTIMPGRTLTIKDNAAYGMIMMQGHGKMGVWDIETPTLIRFGQLTHDEFFVSEQAAKNGLTITNPSQTDPIVMLKHFGPENPDLVL